MRKRLLSGLAVWTLIVGYCLALGETSVASSQNMTAQAVLPVPDTPPLTAEVRSDPPVDRQMWAFEHHARVNMILYTGRFGQGEWATTRNHLDAIALSLKAGSK